MNKQIILISGESGTGKSRCLKNLPNHERVVYLNCEADKQLPFKNNFQKHTITEPEQVPEAITAYSGDSNYDIIIVDTLTFLMNMYETKRVIPSEDSRAAWGDYAQYFINLMQETVAKSDKHIIFLAHTNKELQNNEYKVSVPVKGALKTNGLEAFFNVVISTKRMLLKDLEPYKNDMLDITEKEKMLEYKHVFQTQPTKSTTGERIRSPEDLFSIEETFIDNDAALVLEHLINYYN